MSGKPLGLRQAGVVAGRRLAAVHRVRVVVAVVLVVLLAGAAAALADTWSTQTSGTSQQLNGVACPTASDCIAVGAGGTIVASTNAGSTWSTQTSGVTAQLNAVSCASASACVAVGASGTIVASTNGGSSWSSETSGTTNALYGVSCPTASDCIAVGTGGTIVASTNGGSSWSSQTSGVTAQLNAVSCASASACVAVGASGTIVASTNGGSSWSSETSGTTNALDGLSCQSAADCFAVGAGGTIVASTNGGLTWPTQTSGVTAQLNAVSCASASACWAVGASGTIVTTHTSGSTWGSQTSGTTNALYGAACGTAACWAVGASGTIVTTTAPADSALPSVTGTVAAGDTLTASPGTWLGEAPIAYAYQWEDCTNAAETSCSSIASATGATYTLQSSDVGSYVTVTVTASNTAGSGSASSPGALVAGSSSYAGLVQAASPEAFWPLDDASLPTAFDVSGHGNDGRYSFGVTSSMLDQPGFGGGGGSLGLLGNQAAYVQLSGGLLATSGPFTVQAWFKTARPPGIILGAENSLTARTSFTPMLYVDTNGHLEAQMWWDGAANTITSTSLVDDDAWHEAVLSITAAGTETLTLDGVQLPTTTLSADRDGPEPYATIGVGQASGWPNINGWTGFAGQLADVAFYNSVLSQTTIQNQYNAAVDTPPANTALPTITGTPVVGDTLTASPGTWTGAAPISYSYQWQDCTTAAQTSCSSIAGATGPTYTIQSSDLGSDVMVRVTASNTWGSGSASSAAALVAGSGSYRGLVQAASPVAFWPLDDSSLPTAFDVSGHGNNASYASGVTAGMLDQPGFRGSGGGSLGLTGSPSAYVLFSGSLLPAAARASTVQMWFRTSSPSGVLMGRETTLGPSQPGAWDPILYVDSSGYLETELWWDGAYNTIVSKAPVDDGQWHEVVVSATASGAETLSLDGVQQATGTLGSSPPPDYGTVGAGSSEDFPGGVSGWNTFDGQIADVAIYNSALSEATIQSQYNAAQSAPAASASPSIAGTAAVGDTLTASPGTWTGAAPFSYGYQWQACSTAAATSCSSIAGATGSTYTIQSSDVGSYVTVKVTASNTAGTASASSPGTLVAGSSSYAGLVQAAEPVAFWPLDDPSLPTAFDVSGHGNNGTYSAGVTASMLDQPEVGDTGGGSLGLSGNQAAYVQLSGSLLATSGPFTVQAWFKTARPPGIILGAENSLTARTSFAPMLYVDTNGHLEATMWWDGSTNMITSTAVVDDNTWHEAVLSITAAGTETLTLDGVQLPTITLGTDQNGPEPYATIGVGQGTGWPNINGWTGFAGQIADVAFYNSALPQTTIQAQYDAAVQPPPVNTALPTITGTPVVASTLTASPGTWTGAAPISYSYQWQDCNTTGGGCSDIAGATASTYTLADTDAGSTVEVSVTASNAGGSATAASAPTQTVQAVPPAVTTLPSIAGSAIQGQTLTASPGSWSGTTPISYSYQWQDCDSTGANCSAITGATNSTYTLANSDIGSTIVVEVTASNASLPGGGSAQAASSATAVVQAVPPANTVLPAVSGTAQDKQTLTASVGTWSGSAPISYGYEWEDCSSTTESSCTAIAGATAGTYTLQSADVGSYVAVVVSATNAAGTSSATSAEAALVMAVPPSNTAPPAISGSTVQGQTLTASAGSWAGSTPISYSYQWQDCDTAGGSCAPIAGATNSTYTLTNSDVGSTIVVVVTASNQSLPGGGSAQAASAGTTVVKGIAPANTAAPLIAGTAQAGQTLTASTGSWSGSTPISYSYQWQDCTSKAQESCTSIPGATAASYTLQQSDQYFYIAVSVTASNSAGTASAQSAEVAVPGPPRLTFVTQPSDGVAGTALAFQPVVAVEDFPGDPNTDDNTTQVTLTMSGGSTLSCAQNTVTVAAGVATFSGCSIPDVGNYTITASATGLASISQNVTVYASNYTGRFSYTGALQTWVVPAGVTSIEVTATGASGEGPYGGFGGYEQAIIPVTPGQTLNVYVGGVGSNNVGGYNGGGGDNFGYGTSNTGGGASDIRIGGTALSDRVIVAGGGGGSACVNSPSLYGMGGSGGGSTGEQGWTGSGGLGISELLGGAGGSQTAATSGGSLGQGGGGAWCGGDGGGGYYGGAAGQSASCVGCQSGGGGGGSSYTEPSAYDVTSLQGISRGNGQVTINYPAVLPGTASAGTETFTYTGGPQFYTVPPGVTKLMVSAAGAQGDSTHGRGGLGGFEHGVLPVIPGQTLMVVVGGAGSGRNGGFNGGGGGDFGYTTSGGAGGGGSDVRAGATLADRVIVGGAGGGASNNGPAGAGGGGLVGGGGSTGGTQTAGGANTDGWGTGGGFGFGGGDAYQGGDGGGGWYGGGSGSGGGGGGSSYAIPTATNVETAPGVHPGNGEVTISAGDYGPVPLNLRRGCDPAAPGVCDDSVSDVSPGTGDYNHSTTDVSVKSYGPALSFTRTYDSSLAQEQAALGRPGVLGYGWTDNWDAYLTLQTPADAVTVHEPTGAEVQFVPPVNGACPAGTDGPGTAGTYCEAPYVTARLTYDSATQTYTFITHPYAAEVFDQAGRLVSEFGPGEATLTVSYSTPSPGTGNCPSTASSCNTITSASGRTLVIGSNSSGLVTSVTDPLGNTWSYGYCSPPSSTCSAGDLVSVTDPLGNVTSYTYDQGNSDPSLASDLLTITSPNGQPGAQNAGAHLAIGYNSAGQVTSQTDPAGNQTTFDYSGLDASTGSGDTVTTDPDGNETAYGYTGGVEASKTEAYGTANPSTWTYNPDPNTGLDLSIADPDHRTTVYTYGGNGNVTSVTDPLGNVSTYSYNSFDEQTCASKPLAAQPCSSLTSPAAITPGGTITPPSGAPPAYVTYSAYDTAGNLIWTTTGDYAPGSNTAGQSRTTYKLYSGETVTIGGNTDSCAVAPPAHSLPCLTVNPDGVVTQLGYDSSGDLASSSTPDGNAGGEVAETTYGYNADGEQTTVVAPDGNLSGATAADYATTSTYTADGLLHTQTVGSGTAARETVYGYDADGNQSSIEDARGYTTTKLYNADDQVTLVTDPDNQQTLTCYDGDGNVTETVPASGVAANSLTATSCPTSYPAGYGDRLATDATTNTYDALGDKTVVTSPAPAGQTGFETTTNTYDLAGQLKTLTAPPVSNDSGAPSQVTSYTYDAAGELLSTDQHGSPDSVTSYCYDPDGNKTATVAPDGNTGGLTSCSSSAPYQTSSPYQTGYSYDSLGEQISRTTPSTSFVTNPTTSYSYDPAGNVLTSEDPAGVTTTNTYTPLNQLSSVSYSDSTPGASYSYDANGNKLSMSDGTGTSTYTYDPFNELQSYKNGAGNKVSYSYDPDGDLQTLTYPLGAGATWATNPYVTYGYDNADELNSITDFNGTTSSLSNTLDGLPKVLSLGSTGDTITTSYDPTDNPSDIKLANGSTTLQEFAYTDTPSGTTNSETDTPSSPATPAGYNYDAQGRVTQMTPGSSSPNNYGYDPSGNLTTLPTGASGSYDHASELTSSTLSGATTNYTYNKDGERTAESAGGSSTVTAGYNGAQELTSYSNSAGNMTAATYDGDGLRQSATTTPAGGSSSTENFTWDPSGSLPRLLMDSNNAYIYGSGGTPFEQVNLATGTVQYLLADSLGSVRGVIDSTGALKATTSYDAWGNPQTSGGLTSHTPFGYAGYYTDPTGLTYNIARYYDPTTGQFFVIDPKFETTLQAYEYASDNPVLNTDPSGADLPGEDWAGGATAGEDPQEQLFGQEQLAADDPEDYPGGTGETPTQALNQSEDAIGKTNAEFSKFEKLIAKVPPDLYFRALKILGGLSNSAFSHGEVAPQSVEEDIWTSRWQKVAWFGKQLVTLVRDIKGWPR